jgi:hypothetical protein
MFMSWEIGSSSTEGILQYGFLIAERGSMRAWGSSGSTTKRLGSDRHGR